MGKPQNWGKERVFFSQSLQKHFQFSRGSVSPLLFPVEVRFITAFLATKSNVENQELRVHFSKGQTALTIPEHRTIRGGCKGGNYLVSDSLTSKNGLFVAPSNQVNASNLWFSMNPHAVCFPQSPAVSKTDWGRKLTTTSALLLRPLP